MDIEFIIFIAIIVFTLIALILLLLNKKPSPDRKRKEQVISKLTMYEAQINSNDNNSLKLAIINLDKLLDEALKALNVKGDNFVKRMQTAKNKFKSYESYDATWKAHKVRNQIAHDTNYTPSNKELQKAYNDLRSNIIQLMK